LISCGEAQHIEQQFYQTYFSQEIGCIKIMIKHMRNIRSISIRNMASVVETLLLVL
jgi:hypothetical protein